MPGGKKQVSIQYRRLDDEQGAFGDHTLQSALTAAMHESHEGGTIGGRPERRSIPDAEYGTLLLNDYHPSESFFFGEVVRFEPGAQLPLLRLAVNGNSYNLLSGKVPDGHEPVRGILYFAAFGNHVALFENDIAAGRLERYLRWLLSRACNMIPRSAGVVLEANLKVEEGVAQLPNFNEVVLHPPALTASQMAQGALLASSEQPAHETHDIGKMRIFDVLAAAGIDSADVNKLIEEKIDLEVSLRIKFKSQRFKHPVAMERASRLFRNVDPNDLTLHAPGATQHAGRLIKLTRTALVKTDGTLFDTKDVMRALADAHHFFTGGGYVVS